ncbi:hypothetical protein CLOM_g24678 [Closterium sp. NIES-68]|nr:hypothetical protein CLOM_g24678 [Closterium sp. NIES-68]GJP83590.1 hypothetical protein CLOP_g13723 [Closterium sp. NIES-67]
MGRMLVHPAALKDISFDRSTCAACSSQPTTTSSSSGGGGGGSNSGGSTMAVSTCPPETTGAVPKKKTGRLVSAISRFFQKSNETAAHAAAPEADAVGAAPVRASAAAAAATAVAASAEPQQRQVSADSVIERVVAEGKAVRCDGFQQAADEDHVRRHVSSLPARYVAAGYSPATVRSHMAMLEEAASLREGIPAIRVDAKNGDASSAGSTQHDATAVANMGAAPNCDSDDDCDGDSSVDGLSLGSFDDSLSVSRTEITFACSSHVCADALSSALHRAGMRAYGLTTYDTKSGFTLGHFVLRASIAQFSMRELEDVVATACKRRSPRASLSASAPRAHALQALPEVLGEKLTHLVGKMSPLHHLTHHHNHHHHHHHHGSGSWNLGSVSPRRAFPHHSGGAAGSPVLAAAAAASRFAGAAAASPPASSPDGNGLLHVLLSERGAMKKKLGALIMDPMKLEIGALIAVGASGEVRKGEYEGEEVAVKILKGEGKDIHSMVAEFRREVVTLMSCGECPQLLKFLGVCVDVRGRMCIVTKFMEGGTLSEMLRRRQPLQPSQQQQQQQQQQRGAARKLSTKEVLSIAMDVAKAMAFLHKHGMIHRDLKSANILLDRDNRAVVGDFGVVRLKTERGEMTKEVGTYRWMAPEAFGTSSWPVTHKADVYSYGIVLWELVAGEVPFADYSPLQAAVAVALNGARPPVPGNCPAGLRRLMERCWDKAPKERPEFTEVIGALQQMMREEEQREKSSETVRESSASSCSRSCS